MKETGGPATLRHGLPIVSLGLSDALWLPAYYCTNIGVFAVSYVRTSSLEQLHQRLRGVVTPGRAGVLLSWRSAHLCQAIPIGVGADYWSFLLRRQKLMLRMTNAIPTARKSPTLLLSAPSVMNMVPLIMKSTAEVLYDLEDGSLFIIEVCVLC